jgi:hypothetical protein
MALKREGENMPSIDQRVAYLEGKTEDQAGAVAELRSDMRDLRVEMREVRTEIRELRADMIRLYQALDTKINWVIGTQLAMALAVIGVLLKR